MSGAEATVAVAWRCECHPQAQWGYFADYPGCPISDLNYADPASTTYGVKYPGVAELVAAHPPQVRAVAWRHRARCANGVTVSKTCCCDCHSGPGS